MAGGLQDPLVVFWKEWGILVLVLMSFAMQVILLVTAEIRRRKDSNVLKVIVWSAYLLADTTAIYALGRMSVTSPMLQERQLMAFWAPFLLLHLGGQDNITAYSIEDNRLWLRHLQSFVVEVLAAAYILYQSSIVVRRTLLRTAAILTFLVGVVKYLERVCALKLASSSNLSGSNYQSFFRKIAPEDPTDSYFYDDELSQAHVLLEFPMHLLKGPLPLVTVGLDYRCDWETIYGVAEKQLSLMHDVFYSKAELIYTWYGYCIRVVSLVATITTLVLFCRFSEKDSYRRVDVAATYVLVAGAIVLEMASVLRAMSSTWIMGMFARSLVRTRSSCSKLIFILSFPFLLPLVIWAFAVHRRSGCKGRRVAARYWSHSMGQHNFIHMCSHCKDSRSSKMARWVGREDWWNMLVYTSSIPVSAGISELLQKYIEKSQVTIYKKIELHSGDRAGLYEELGWSVHREKLDASILVWHIATHVYLSWYEGENAGRPHHLAQVTKELSNYMMFLLAARPYMLPDSASRQRYIQLCNTVIHELNYSTEDDLLRLIRNPADQVNSGPFDPEQLGDDTLEKACRLSAKLISKEQETPDANMLELISQVWAELLCHAAYGCKPDSHVRRLSNGGELTTLVAFCYSTRNRVFYNQNQWKVLRKTCNNMSEVNPVPWVYIVS